MRSTLFLIIKVEIAMKCMLLLFFSAFFIVQNSDVLAGRRGRASAPQGDTLKADESKPLARAKSVRGKKVVEILEEKELEEAEESLLEAMLKNLGEEKKTGTVGKFEQDEKNLFIDPEHNVSLAATYIPELNKMLVLKDRQLKNKLIPLLEAAINIQGKKTNFGKALGVVLTEFTKETSEGSSVAKSFDKWRGSKVETKDLTGKKFALDENNFPTDDQIRKLADEEWPNLQPFTVEALGQDEAGANSGKIWKVFAKIKNDATLKEEKKLLFFFKVSKNKQYEIEAWKKLRKIQTSGVGRLNYLAQHRNKDKYKDLDFPIITSMEKFFTYKSKIGETRVIEVVHAAQGTAAVDVIEGKKSYDGAALALMATSIGKAIGSLHRVFFVDEKVSPSKLLGVIHGDCHPANVFVKYVAASKFSDNLNLSKFIKKAKNNNVAAYCRVYLIDNETIYDSLGEKNNLKKPYMDLFQFVLHPILYWQYLNKSVMNDKQWSKILIFFKQVLDGYISVFSAEYQPKIESYMKQIFSTRFQAAIDFVESVKTGKTNSVTDKVQLREQTTLFFNSMNVLDKTSDEKGSWSGLIEMMARIKRDKNSQPQKQAFDDIKKRLTQALEPFKVNMSVAEQLRMSLQDLQENLSGVKGKIETLKTKLQAVSKKVGKK